MDRIFTSFISYRHAIMEHLRANNPATSHRTTPQAGCPMILVRCLAAGTHGVRPPCKSNVRREIGWRGRARSILGDLSSRFFSRRCMRTDKNGGRTHVSTGLGPGRRASVHRVKCAPADSTLDHRRPADSPGQSMDPDHPHTAPYRFAHIRRTINSMMNIISRTHSHSTANNGGSVC
jgi:hypothetical protein